MICVDIDVAKDTHWACALDPGGRVLLNRAVRNTQTDLDALSAELRNLPAPVQVGLDVDGSIATSLQALLLADGLDLILRAGTGRQPRRRRLRRRRAQV